MVSNRHLALIGLVPLALSAACQDGDGGITADNARPEVDILSPQDGATYSETEEIIVRGTAGDREDLPEELQITLILGNGEPVTVTPDATGDWRYVLPVQAPGTYALEARARDTLSATTSAEIGFTVQAVNKAPTATIDAPEDGASWDEGDTVVLEGTVGDDASLAALTVQWSSSLDGVLGSSAPDIGGHVSLRTDALSPGNHQLRLIAQDGEGLVGQDEIGVTVIDINVAPEDPDVILSPSSPTTVDDIELSILNEGEDADGDEVEYEIRWYVDGSLQGDLDGRTLVPAARTTRGELWRVDVTASDPSGAESALMSDEVEVVDSAPTLATATLSPAVAYQYSTLSVILSGGADADGDVVTYLYQWTVNGATIPDYTASTLNGDHFSRGDEVRAQVTPTDGTEDGAPVVTAPVTIQDAKALGLTVEIIPDAPVITDALVCDVLTPAQDVDGDAVTYTYTWTRDGVAVYTDEVGRDTIDSRETAVGETWKCTVTPWSGGVAGEAASDQVVIRAGSGSILVTEIMARPTAGAAGEYVELYNGAGVTVDLSGWVLRDDSGDRFVISPSAALELAGGAYLVIGASADAPTNGGIPVDLVWSGFSLGDTSDEVVVEADGEVVDRVRYGSAVGIVAETGAALNLDVGAYDAAANDAATSWCRATTPLDDGGFGTPGALNDLCACAQSDQDGDGWGSDEEVCAELDCNDQAPGVSPSATEACEDGIDNDCSGGDTLCDCEASDSDGDGYGDAMGCPAISRDCDDANPDTWPGAPELCDAEDNDCDKVVDDGLDKDDDGARVCPVEGEDEDCDDLDPTVYPAATEACDTKDNNCNGRVDEGFDVDGDDYTTCGGDCNDADATINPGAAEICEDGKDNNCSGSDANCACASTDVDGDGFGSGAACPANLKDCDDANPQTYPQATERCDDFDNDCDSNVDEGLDVDADTYETCDPTHPDCNDADPAVHYGVDETCDRVDQDCDGLVDEGYDLDGDTYVTCGPTLTQDCDDLNPTIHPLADEECDAVDNDCDGVTDEGAEDDYEPNDRKEEAYDGGFLVAGIELTLTIDKPGDVDWLVFTTSDVGLASSYLRVDTVDIAIEAQMCNARLPDLCVDVQAGPGYDTDTEFFPSAPFPQGGDWYLEVKAVNPTAVSCHPFTAFVWLK